jgi:hypothetical protein
MASRRSRVRAPSAPSPDVARERAAVSSPKAAAPRSSGDRVSGGDLDRLETSALEEVEPAAASFVSANGPSVISHLPPRTRTERARRGGASWSPVRRIPRASRSSTQGKGSSPSPAPRSDPAPSGHPFAPCPSRPAAATSSSLLSFVVCNLTQGRRTSAAPFDISRQVTLLMPDWRRSLCRQPRRSQRIG